MNDLKATLNDEIVSRLPQAEKGQYVVRDTDLKGFFIVIGTRKKTFTVQGEFWRDGSRQSKKVAIGDSKQLTTRDARVRAKEVLAKIARGELSNVGKPKRTPVPTSLSAQLGSATA